MISASGATPAGVLIALDRMERGAGTSSAVAEVRERRRSGLLSHEVNVRFDENMGEIILNCDEGRIRRPLLVVKDGHLVLTRKHLEDLKLGRLRFSDLVRNGVVTWDGEASSLKHFKDDRREVTAGYECGIGLAGFSDLKVGDIIVTAGQLKLRNGAAVVINNTVQPSDSPAPRPDHP